MQNSLGKRGRELYRDEEIQKFNINRNIKEVSETEKKRVEDSCGRAI